MVQSASRLRAARAERKCVTPSIWCQAPSFGHPSMPQPQSDNTPSMSTNSSGFVRDSCNFAGDQGYLGTSKAGSLPCRGHEARVKWVQRGADGRCNARCSCSTSVTPASADL